MSWIETGTHNERRWSFIYPEVPGHDVREVIPKGHQKPTRYYYGTTYSGSLVSDHAGFFDRPILDVTPSRVLPAPDDHDDMEAAPARLRKLTAEEAAEQRQRVRRPQTRERVRRSR
jgi:hypothetical protein